MATLGNGLCGKPKSVVIVGAGAASIKLAHTLWKDNSGAIDQITILEANNYIGGRVRHFQFADHTVEMGANWISGRETAYDNPIWRLAQSVDLRGHSSEDRDNPERIHVVNCGNGAAVTKEYLEQVKRFDTIYGQALEQVQGPDSTVCNSSDTDVRSVLEQYGWTPKHQLTNVERAVEHNILEVWATDHLEQLSAAHDLQESANDVELGQDEMFVEDPRGFNSIFDGMVQEMTKDGKTTILLHKQVQSIHYKPGQVNVVAKNVESGQEAEYPADLVVSTVSLGVLQNQECIQFVPPLPHWKVNALNQIEMFCFAKVYAKFRKRLWPQDKDYLIFVLEGEGNRGYYPVWMRYKNTNEHLFMCYLGGPQARRVESLDTEQIKDEIAELFCKAFGPSPDCRPQAVAVTDWSRNPYFFGSYSSYPKNSLASVPLSDLQRGLSGDNGDDKELSEKQQPTLYFAGEAFDDKFNGWVQGAYLSGERVAEDILSDMRRQ